jgi:hypothetical protein
MPIPSPFYGSDYVVINSGATFALGADPVLNISGGYTTYFQYYKLGFGATGAFSPVTASNPFPVTMSAGLTATISGFSGPIAVTGLAGGAVNVLGTVVVSGLTSAPVFIQTAPNSRVEVTGGRFLNRLTDNVSVFGPNGSTWIYANLVSGNGSVLGTTSNPMYVNITGATIQATVAATVGVTNATAGIGLLIQGMSGGYSVATTVGNTVGINDTSILTGMTSIYAQLINLNSQILSIAGSVPSTIKSSRTAPTAVVSQMDPTGFTCSYGINLKAAATNTNLVYFAGNTGVSAVTSYGLDPGEEIFVKVNNTNKIFTVTGSGTQALFYNAS